MLPYILLLMALVAIACLSLAGTFLFFMGIAIIAKKVGLFDITYFRK